MKLEPLPPDDGAPFACSFYIPNGHGGHDRCERDSIGMLPVDLHQEVQDIIDGMSKIYVIVSGRCVCKVHSEYLGVE